MNVRRGACEAQASLRNASAFFHFYIWGQGLAIGGYRLKSLWAWTVVISTVHAPRLCLQPQVLGWLMGRNRPQSMPAKLRLIRERLQLDHAHMAEQLVSEIESHSKQRIEIKTSWVKHFELGKHEPDLIIVNSYSRLAKIPMELIVDDAVSVAAFRGRLGKEPQHKRIDKRTDRTGGPK
jgi:hypothetical protein